MFYNVDDNNIIIAVIELSVHTTEVKGFVPCCQLMSSPAISNAVRSTCGRVLWLSGCGQQSTGLS